MRNILFAIFLAAGTYLGWYFKPQIDQVISDPGTISSPTQTAACTTQPLDVTVLEGKSYGYDVVKTVEGVDMDAFKNALITLGVVASVEDVDHFDKLTVFFNPQDPDNVMVVTTANVGGVDCEVAKFPSTKAELNGIFAVAGLEQV